MEREVISIYNLPVSLRATENKSTDWIADEIQALAAVRSEDLNSKRGLEHLVQNEKVHQEIFAELATTGMRKHQTSRA